jgi:hypothetical protein
MEMMARLAHPVNMYSPSLLETSIILLMLAVDSGGAKLTILGLELEVGVAEPERCSGWCYNE